MIEAIGVVVPVHDEEMLLPTCLVSLSMALERLPASMQHVTVVVLDACSDLSESIARGWVDGDHERRACITVDFRNVGRTRAAGMHHALESLSIHARDCTWLATTDADSAVPRTWLTEQLRLAAQGVEAAAGSIRVSDWTAYPPGFGERFRHFYEPPGSDEDSHAHVHGANLGVRADAYLASGGFEALATGEDHALWRALHRVARSRVSSRRFAVTTSARAIGRAPDGFSGFLAHRRREIESERT